MLRRALILVLLAWGILGVPTLCRAGVLEHHCECGFTSSCSHEESCGSDPCTLAKPANDGATVQPLAPSPMAVPAFHLGCASPSKFLAMANPNPLTIPPSPTLNPGARPLLV